VSLDGGSVSVIVDSSGQPNLSGSGLALSWAQATVAAALAELPPLPALGSTAAPYRPERPATQSDRDHAIGARRTLFQDKVRDANALGPALVQYLTGNAQIALGSVTAQIANVSVGAVPNPNTPGVAISPPPAPVSLPLSGTGTLT
jgi:hypothetical protein